MDLFPGRVVPLFGLLNWRGLLAWICNCSWSGGVSGCDGADGPGEARGWALRSDKDSCCPLRSSRDTNCALKVSKAAGWASPSGRLLTAFC